MLRFLRCLSLLLILPTLCTAADSAAFYHFTTDNGLPSNHVYNMIRDKSGTTWIATDNGVAKYDGYRFTIFSTKQGLPSNDVWSLYADRVGRIWLFSNAHEIGYLKNDVYHPIKLNNGSSNIYPVEITSAGESVVILYVGHHRYEIALIHNNIAIPQPLTGVPTFRQPAIRAASLSDNGFLWLAYYYDNVSRIRLFDTGRDVRTAKADRDTYPILSKSNSVLSTSSRLYGYTQKMYEVWTFDLHNAKFSNIDLRETGSGHITVAYTIGEILHVITERAHIQINGDKIISNVPLNIPTTAPVTYINRFRNTEWYCTGGDGIWIKHKSLVLKERIVEESLLNGSIPVGSRPGVIYWWNAAKNRLIRVTSAGHKIVPGTPPPGTLRYVDMSGKRAVYLFGSGTYQYDTTTQKFVSIFKQKNLLLHNYFFYGNDKSVERFDDSLARTYYKNLFQMHRISDTSYLVFARNTVDLFTDRKEHFESVRFIKERGTGFTRLSSLPFVCVYNRKNIYLFSHDLRKRIKFSGASLGRFIAGDIKKIVESADGEIYILTNRALYKMLKGTLLKRIRTGINLSSADLFIAKNHLVLTGEFGIAFAEKSRLEKGFSWLSNYKRECYKMITHSVVDSSGKAYLVTDKGTFSTSLTEIFLEKKLPNLKQIPLRFLSNIRSAPLKNTDTVILSGTSPRLTLSVINNQGAGNPQLFYKLGDADWTEALAGEIPSDHLKPDRFYKMTFYAQDDFRSCPQMTLYIFKQPLWWQQTRWQLTFVAGGILIFSVSILIATSIARNRAARASEKRRLQTELELRAIHSQINPHFIFNTLSTALFFISKQQTKDAYEHVSNFSKLLRNYLKSSRERFITLADEIAILSQYIELQQARFSKGFQYEIRVAEDIVASHILIPSLLLQPLVENAINHGLFNKKGKGNLTLTFRRGAEPSHLVCIIDDNGIGRAKAKELNKRYKSQRSSYGTALTRELIDILKRYEAMDITLDYIDKAEPETGTTVKLTIKNVKVSEMG